MRLPRDVSGKDLITALRTLGYEVTRQTGSHIRMTTSKHGKHHVTVPNHNPLRIGTFAGILDDIAEHFDTDRLEVLARIKL